jgi:HNH endonuclease/AP2 domain
MVTRVRIGEMFLLRLKFNMKPLPNLTVLREYFRYLPESGKVICIKRSGSKSKLGEPIGNLNSYGYFVTCFAGQKYFVHRIAWMLHTSKDPGKFEIDHINGDTTDNRACNLRLATHGNNMHNSKKHRDNTSGFKGVYWHKKAKSWMGYSRVNGKMFNLGLYPTPEAADKAVRAYRETLHGEFTNHG